MDAEALVRMRESSEDSSEAKTALEKLAALLKKLPTDCSARSRIIEWRRAARSRISARGSVSS
jgi:hypothetical protein